MNLIESSHWRLWSEPAQGVQWLAAQVKHGKTWQDVIPDCRASSSTHASAAGTLSAASFHMIPYSNRIRHGHFRFNGKNIQLDHGQTHAIHGALRKLPWREISSDKQSLICEFDSLIDGPINWPWPLKARIEQRLEEAILSSHITIRNQGSTDMPVGTGWHPYFVRNIGKSGPTLTLPVDAVFNDTQGDCLPVGAAHPLPAHIDFRKPRLLDADQRIDCCLAGLSAPCYMHWQDAGIELRMSASEACRFLVLFNPDAPYFAVEPVTNANDAFNLSNEGIDAGLTVLAPDEQFSVSMQLEAILHT